MPPTQPDERPNHMVAGAQHTEIDQLAQMQAHITIPGQNLTFRQQPEVVLEQCLRSAQLAVSSTAVSGVQLHCVDVETRFLRRLNQPV